MPRRIRASPPPVDCLVGAVVLAIASTCVLATVVFDASSGASTQSASPSLDPLGVLLPPITAVLVGGAAFSLALDDGPGSDARLLLAWLFVGVAGVAITVASTVGFLVRQWAASPVFVLGAAGVWGGTVGLLVGVSDVRRRRRCRDLEHVNELNAQLRAANTAIVAASSREEIERDVCDRLTDLEGVSYAWFGDLARGGGDVVPRSSCGDVPDTARTVRADGGTSVQAEALRAGEPAVRECGPDSGEGAVAATPVVYDEFPYGVLTVGLDEDFEYGPFECRTFAHLGRQIGDAIHALRSRQALVADSVVELSFEVSGEDCFATSVTAATGGRLELRGAQVSSGSLFAFYDTGRVDPHAVAEVADSNPSLPGVTVVDAGEDGTGRVQVVDDSPVYATVTDRGGSVRSLAAEGGTGELRVRLPRSADVRAAADAVVEACPGAELVARKDEPGPVADEPTVEEWADRSLTQRQLLVARTAYHGGYFESPRRCSGEELAASLDLSAPTFHDHLRTAERTLFETAFEGSQSPAEAGG